MGNSVKKVLITGAGSYIGTSFLSYIKEHESKIQINTLDMLSSDWRSHDFSCYDSIFHVAGIAHADVSKVSQEVIDLYYCVNTKLTIEVATKARDCGVRQFIFMSSMIVYGDACVVTQETKPNPSNFYGDSKLQAEIGLASLATDEFLVAIMRPPMIYGRDSKGNFPLLAKLAKKTPIFPKSQNERSMLYVEHLCEFVRQVILYEDSGIFFPQNKEYVTTSDLVYEISRAIGKKLFRVSGCICLIHFMQWICAKIPLAFTRKVSNLLHKVFSTLRYEKIMSDYRENTYQMYDFRKTIEKSVG
ncbi:MAG: NAD-dependent epimerase/dehydratase family protein [Lachnospiraceae bacterium]